MSKSKPKSTPAVQYGRMSPEHHTELLMAATLEDMSKTAYLNSVVFPAVENTLKKHRKTLKDAKAVLKKARR